MKRTFDIDCPGDIAAERLDLPPDFIPCADSFHPLAIDMTGGTFLLCVHDEENEAATVVEVPREMGETFPEEDAMLAHLDRIVKAGMN
jgi:hypothetical protein